MFRHLSIKKEKATIQLSSSRHINCYSFRNKKRRLKSLCITTNGWLTSKDMNWRKRIEYSYVIEGISLWLTHLLRGIGITMKTSTVLSFTSSSASGTVMCFDISPELRVTHLANHHTVCKNSKWSIIFINMGSSLQKLDWPIVLKDCLSGRIR